MVFCFYFVLGIIKYALVDYLEDSQILFEMNQIWEWSGLQLDVNDLFVFYLTLHLE